MTGTSADTPRRARLADVAARLWSPSWSPWSCWLLAGMLFAPSSLNKGAVLGMLPFAAVLAIVALGQTLVVQQGGIDLSVAGSVSLVVVIITHEP